MQTIVVSAPMFVPAAMPTGFGSFGLNPFTLPMCQDAPGFGGDSADMARRRRRRSRRR